MWGCEVRTRLMKLACSPASIADMKTMTADADGDATYNERRLHPAFLKETDSGNPLEWHPTVHGITGLMRWPVLTPAVLGVGEVTLRDSLEDLYMRTPPEPQPNWLLMCPVISHDHYPWRPAERVINVA